MDFHQLLAKMQELDTPVQEASIEECGGPMDIPRPSTDNTTPPSMSVNLNAQGMDNIEDLLKLITKVNPDAEKGVDVTSEPIKPAITPGFSQGVPPLKMLPDFDNDEGPDDNKIDVIKIDGDDEQKTGEAAWDDAPMDLDSDDDYEPYNGEHDPDADDLHGYEKYKAKGGKLSRNEWEFDQSQRNPWDSEDEENEAYENEPDTEFKSADYMNNKLAGGMNKPKQMFKHSYRQGDNPMAMEGEDLRSWIKTELKQRLEEAKGAK